MASAVHSIVDSGSTFNKIVIECHLSKGLPSLLIVGMGNKAVDEARERIRSAMTNIGLALPKKRITINLAPGDLPKLGTSFDVGIALSIMLADGQCNIEPSSRELFIGELGLDGSVRSVRGIIGKLLSARTSGARRVYLPIGNLNQAALVPNIEIVPIESLKDIYLHFSGTLPLKPYVNKNTTLGEKAETVYDHNFAEVVGQARAKRALEIAAAGGHNVLMGGPPGTGKSMLARALPSILPTLSDEECLEVTHLHSLASTSYEKIINSRPFRTPHHSASTISLIGGGQNPRPGEISLAHQGVLFLDELPEFSRTSIESLRQPLEDSVITVARAKETITYPANFMLAATANLCPCGYYGSQKPCSCSANDISKYQRKLSGPIIDRIDLHITVDDVEHTQLLTTGTAEDSQTIYKRVQEARAVQNRRYGLSKTNARLGNKDIKRFARPVPAAKTLLDQAASSLNISARSYMRTLKVARTIADLAGKEDIDTEHIAEALQYRWQPVDL